MRTMNTTLPRLAAYEWMTRVRLALSVSILLLASCSTPTELTQAPADPVAAAPSPPAPPPIEPLSPEASIATMELPKGYRLEPVLAEPNIAEPVMIAFDGNGRMYVAEMRTYMLDAGARWVAGVGDQETQPLWRRSPAVTW